MELITITRISSVTIVVIVAWLTKHDWKSNIKGELNINSIEEHPASSLMLLVSLSCLPSFNA